LGDYLLLVDYCVEELQTLLVLALLREMMKGEGRGKGTKKKRTGSVTRDKQRYERNKRR
jgi:hypothetical protein